MAKIGMIGAGSWGTALTCALGNNGHEVCVWSIAESEVNMLNDFHEQKEKLPGVLLPASITATTKLDIAIYGMDLMVLAVPSPFTRSTARMMAPYVRQESERRHRLRNEETARRLSEGEDLEEISADLKKRCGSSFPRPLIVSVAKGLEENSLMTLSEIISQEIPEADVAVLCGPTHAEEVGRGMPTLIVAGSANPEIAAYVQDIFMSETLRVYTSPDVLGMQIGAAAKNVVALAAGIADGLGYGDNTKAALITRGIAEITRLGTAAGGNPETFSGLTGIGDLIVTCASMHSRNRRAGILIGQGKSAEEAMKEVGQVVEGVFSARASSQLAEKYHVETPIINQICSILFEGKDPAEAVRELMLRDRKAE
ncbi:MAG: NAD(P)-dependent glycerol-3-phosphate dehydrogenase [Lachnospiraceae bacterium]|nr:NAD(P)-dependent glycerol-3-phosphate dehydrogenase [Lachnospiraceae bacterium]